MNDPYIVLRSYAAESTKYRRLAEQSRRRLPAFESVTTRSVQVCREIEIWFHEQLVTAMERRRPPN